MPFYCTHIEMVVVQVLDITSVRYLIRVNRSLRRVQFGLAKNYNFKTFASFSFLSPTSFFIPYSACYLSQQVWWLFA
uniref:F-box domain-containing protein n=1 Tax=Panagrellus redivivus TaxID=6233 RepID=A0A7E4W4S3_PANRE